MKPAAAEHSAVERLAVLAGLFDTRPLNPQQIEIAQHCRQRLEEIAAEIEHVHAWILSARIADTTSDMQTLFINARTARASLVGGLAGYLAARQELTDAAR